MLGNHIAAKVRTERWARSERNAWSERGSERERTRVIWWERTDATESGPGVEWKGRGVEIAVSGKGDSSRTRQQVLDGGGEESFMRKNMENKLTLVGECSSRAAYDTRMGSVGPGFDY